MGRFAFVLVFMCVVQTWIYTNAAPYATNTEELRSLVVRLLDILPGEGSQQGEEKAKDKISRSSTVVNTGDLMQRNSKRNAACGGYSPQILTGQSGIIRSPTGRGNNYPNSVNCAWLINVAAGQRVQIQFSRFSLESHRTCGWDYLAVYDGADTNSQLMEKVCGQQIPRDITAQGNQMYIKFHTDSSVTSTGFELTYSAVGGYDCINSDPCIGQEGGYYPHINKGKFIQCGHGVCYVQPCPAGLVWDQNILACNWPKEETTTTSHVQTITTPTSTPLRYDCITSDPCIGKEGGYYPHFNKGKFIQCGHGVCYVQICPAALVWDQNILACNWP